MPVNTGNDVYSSLCDLLLSGDIRPGERLVQHQVAKRLGTTTTPLREALQRLEAEGIVETIPGFKGVRLRSFDTNQIVGEAVVRRAIEGEAARLCAREATDDELAFLMQTAKKCDELVEAPKQDIEQIDALFAEIEQ